MIFKGIRDLGLLDDLKQRLKELQSQELTLEQMNEDILLENYYYRFPINGAPRQYVFTYSANEEEASKIIVKYSSITNYNDINQVPSPVKVDYKDVKNYIEHSSKSVNQILLGKGVVRASRADANDLGSGLVQTNNKTLVHHINEDPKDNKHNNLIVIEYPNGLSDKDGLRACKGLHWLMHSLHYGNRYANQDIGVDIKFYTLENPAVAHPHIATITLKK